MAPPPLPPAQKRIVISAFIAGIVIVLVVLFRVFTLKSSELGVVDAMIGSGGGAMLVYGALGLFHRPDR